jgi:hypothetical protein
MQTTVPPPVNLALPENLLRYSSDEEYRDVFNLFFGSAPVDPDEDCYEESKVKAGMSWIYEHTRADPFWRGVYQKAAAKFFSEDGEIGLCVLLNYDYFPDFFRALRIFTRLGFPATSAGSEPNADYGRLRTRLVDVLDEP